MGAPSATPATSRLRRLAQREREEERPSPTGEQCELCGEPIPAEHRHLVDLSSRTLMCACRACTLLFDHRAAGGGHYRLVPDRRLRIVDLELDNALWDRLRIPVEMAFFFTSSQAERTVALYPGPMGATESLLDLDAWRELEAANPVLAEIKPDVEALLVNRAGELRGGWVVPIDDCYDLAGLMRTHWTGLSGGRAVWSEIAAFFERLDGRAKVFTRQGVASRSSAPAVSHAGDGKE